MMDYSTFDPEDVSTNTEDDVPQVHMGDWAPAEDALEEGDNDADTV